MGAVKTEEILTCSVKNWFVFLRKVRAGCKPGRSLTLCCYHTCACYCSFWGALRMNLSFSFHNQQVFFLSVLLQEYWPLFLHRSSNLQMMFEARSFSSLSLFRANNSCCAVWYTSASHDREKVEKPRGGTKSAVKTKNQISSWLLCAVFFFQTVWHTDRGWKEVRLQFLAALPVSTLQSNTCSAFSLCSAKAGWKSIDLLAILSLWTLLYY